MNVKTDQANRTKLVGNVKKQYKNIYSFDLPDNESNVMVCTDNKYNCDSLSAKTKELQKFSIAKHSGKLNNNNFDLLSMVDYLIKE